MVRIEKIRVLRTVDSDPDISWIGEFRNHADPNDPKVVEHAYNNPSEYNYFISTNAETREQALQDYNRMMKYVRGDLCDIGIKVEATIAIPMGNYSILQKISSGGLWGIASDSEDSDMQEIAREQAAELKEILSALGIEWDGDISEIEPTNL